VDFVENGARAFLNGWVEEAALGRECAKSADKPRVGVTEDIHGPAKLEEATRKVKTPRASRGDLEGRVSREKGRLIHPKVSGWKGGLFISFCSLYIHRRQIADAHQMEFRRSPNALRILELALVTGVAFAGPVYYSFYYFFDLLSWSHYLWTGAD